MDKKLRALAAYENGPRGLHYKAGDEFEATPQLALFLMADAPGCFEPVVEVVDVKAVASPPVDKMVRTPKGKK
jgi:hypothetical protein